MGIVRKNADFYGSETDSAEREKCPWGKEMGVQKDRKEALVLIPHQITTKHTECVHTCIMFVLSLIVNTATGSQSHGQALGLKSLMQSFLPASVQ